MNAGIVAVICQEGGRIVSELIRQRITVIKPDQLRELTKEKETPPDSKEKESPEYREKATSTKSGCIQCAIGHLGTCSGLLNEAVRFAREDGLASTEVIDRMNMCLDELNTMERVDMRPEMIQNLPEDDKSIANAALTTSRQIRHGIESLNNSEDLESLAAATQTIRGKIGHHHFRKRLINMPKKEKRELIENTIKNIEEGPDEL